MDWFVAAIDCGTTAVKAAVVDQRGRIISLGSREVACRYTKDGGVEQDPQEILKAVFASLREAIQRSKVDAHKIGGLAVANQRATVLCLDKAGRPLGPALVWLDMRGSGELRHLKASMGEARYYGITGLPLNPVFSLSKILWLRKNRPDIFRKTARFALVHDFVVRALGADDIYTDHSNASLTGLLDIRSRGWSPSILRAAHIRSNHLGTLVPSGERIGTVSSEAARRLGLGPGVMIVAGGGDQQCAGLGAGCVDAGPCSLTIGTAGVCFAASSRPVFDPHRGVTCSVHVVPERWCLEGLQLTAGDSLRWLERVTSSNGKWSDGIVDGDLARSARGAEGVLFFPYLAGAGAPDWEKGASGMFLGLGLKHTRLHLVRAVMEGVAFEHARIIQRFVSLRVPVKEVRIGGGRSVMGLWDRIHAEVCGRPIRRLSNPQSTILGAAMLAGWGIGLIPSLSRAAQDMVRGRESFTPLPVHVASYENIQKNYQDLLGKMKRSGMFAAV